MGRYPWKYGDATLENEDDFAPTNVTEDGLDLDALRKLLAPKEGEPIFSPPDIPKKTVLSMMCTIAGAINTLHRIANSPKYADEAQPTKLSFLELNVVVETLGLYFGVDVEDMRQHIRDSVESGDMILFVKDSAEEEFHRSYG